MKFILHWLFLCCLLWVSACSTPDNSEPPADLTDIENPQPLRKLWSIDTGEGIDEGFFDMQPQLLGNKVYTIDTEGVIHQIDATNGKSEWQFESGLSSITGLSVNSSALVATSRNGELLVFDFADESLKLRWRQQLNSEIRTRAVLHDEQVFVRTVDGKLSAINASNGKILWTVSRRVPALSLTGSSHPVVSDDLVISGFDNGKLVAFERDNGSTAWETTVSSPSGRTEIERLVDLDGQFVLRDGIVYISSYQGNLVAITVSNGQVIWSRKFSSFLAMDADREALYLSDDRSHIWSIDRRTGSAFWKQEVLNARKITAPRLIGDKLIVADLQGYVHWFDKQDGRLLARKATYDNRYLSQPLTIDSTAIVLDSTGRLTALSQAE